MMITDRCLFPIDLIPEVFWTHLARLRSPTSTSLAQLGGDLLGRVALPVRLGVYGPGGDLVVGQVQVISITIITIIIITTWLWARSRCLSEEGKRARGPTEASWL